MTALLMFPLLFALILLGFPVGLSLMGTAFVFALGRFGTLAVYQLASKVIDVAEAHVLSAVPLFIFMGAMFQRSGVAERLFEAIHLWTWRLPGGLAVSAVLLCVLFAMASGVIGATESVVGLLAIPAMLKHGYDRGLIAGTICAGGSLGTIIPPSIVAIVIAAVADVPVGELFAGMFLPGLLLAGGYLVYVAGRCALRPQDGPRTPSELAARLSLAGRLLFTLRVFLPPAAIICATLGSIVLGIATPTEAAAVGAFGSLLLTAAWGRLDREVLTGSLLRTVAVTAMVLTIVLGGSMFASVFIASGGMVTVQKLLGAARLGGDALVLLVLLLAFLGGFFLEPVAIVLLLVPVVLPFLRASGVDPLWFCVLFLVVLQTSYLTPPVAPAIFYLRGIAPPEIRLSDMYRGILPFVLIQILVLGGVFMVPPLATRLPELLFGLR